MSITIIFYIVGIVLSLLGLWWASEKSVEYSLQLSDILGITTFFIGFVLMAVATGLPELAVVIASLWKGVPSVAAGDIIGSNLIDVSLVLGLPAVILGTLNVQKEDKLSLMFMLVVTSLVMGFVFVVGTLGKIHGLILIMLYGVSIWWLWRTRVVHVISQEEVVEELSADKALTWKKRRRTRITVVTKLSVSLALVMLFSKVSVDCAIVVARYFSLRLETIGVTVFAIGTSLPELALSFQAVRKKAYALAFGNVFGSVLEQATLILGFLALGAKQPLDITRLRAVAPLMFLAYAIVAHSVLKKTKVGRQEGLSRTEGAMLLVLFVLHVTYYLFFRPA